jgi:hypothetical protein
MMCVSRSAWPVRPAANVLVSAGRVESGRPSMEQHPNSRSWPARPLTLRADPEGLSFPHNRQTWSTKRWALSVRLYCVLLVLHETAVLHSEQPKTQSGRVGTVVSSRARRQLQQSCSRVAADLWPGRTPSRGTGDGIRGACEETRPQPHAVGYVQGVGRSATNVAWFSR